MTEKELLQAIYNDTQKIKQQITDIEQRLDRIEQRLDNLEQRMDSLEQRMDILEERVDKVQQTVTDVKLTLENETNHNIQLVAENHITLIDKLNRAIPTAYKNLVYEVQMSDFRFRLEQVEKDVSEIKRTIA